MANLVDARGLSCPQPVILTKKLVDSSAPTSFEVLVDNKTASENVTRFSEHAGYKVTVTDAGGDFRLSASKH